MLQERNQGMLLNNSKGNSKKDGMEHYNATITRSGLLVGDEKEKPTKKEVKKWMNRLNKKKKRMLEIE